MLNRKKISCFGEVLWDIFPSGKSAGGAPFNVAYHLNKLGHEVSAISRVGTDDLGTELLKQIKDWNIPQSFIQLDQKHPTSTVKAVFDVNNDAEYIFEDNVAWDYIEVDEKIRKKVASSDAFVFGSLITRSEASRNSLFELLEISKLNIFDINFRPPHYSLEVIRKILYKCHVFKLSKSELRLLLEFLKKDYTDEYESCKFLQETFGIPEIIITKGSKGAVYYNNSNFYNFPVVPVKIGDTIGSGDAFLAGFISKKLENATAEDSMEQAISLGAFVTSKIGACPPYSLPEFISFKKQNKDQFQNHNSLII